MTRSKASGGFGFRELNVFNSAMLATMAGRVLSEPNNLWVQVIKGLYFPSSHCLHAVKGGESLGAGLVLFMVGITFDSMGCGPWGMVGRFLRSWTSNYPYRASSCSDQRRVPLLTATRG